MTVTIEDLAKHLGMAVVPADTEMLERALGAARGVITPHLIADPADGTDEMHTLDTATLTVAQGMWRAKDSTGGSYVFAEGTDQVGVLPRDLLGTVWPMLCEAGLVDAVTV